MELGDIASAQKQDTVHESQGRESQVTGAFPSDKSKKPKNSASSKPSTTDQQAIADQTKPSKFEKQGEGAEKDSEDAESFDDDKQKSMILKEFGLDDADDADDDCEPEKPAEDIVYDENEEDEVEQKGEGRDLDRVSERSNDDEDERRKKEIE